MIFSIQRFLEDYFERLSLQDVDQYAVAIANLYDQSRRGNNERGFLIAIHRIRTAFFRANPSLNRAEFEKSILQRLDGRFKKKTASDCPAVFPGGVVAERRRLLSEGRRSIRSLLCQFKNAIEARAVDSFWISRKRNQLRQRPETISQALLAVFAKGVVGPGGLVLRELASGIGFVDVSVVFSAATPHLIELKVLTGALVGANQLESYMKTEARKRGWLVILEARHPVKRGNIPAEFVCSAGVIKTLLIDINPPVPSKR